MTVGQFLASVDSRELTEWLIMENLPYWENRLAAKENPSGRLLSLIAGTAMAKGAVQHGSK